jgi:hypothetical protein
MLGNTIKDLKKCRFGVIRNCCPRLFFARNISIYWPGLHVTYFSVSAIMDQLVQAGLTLKLEQSISFLLIQVDTILWQIYLVPFFAMCPDFFSF